eukprot:gene9864-20517_t
MNFVSKLIPSKSISGALIGTKDMFINKIDIIKAMKVTFPLTMVNDVPYFDRLLTEIETIFSEFLIEGKDYIKAINLDKIMELVLKHYPTERHWAEEKVRQTATYDLQRLLKGHLAMRRQSDGSSNHTQDDLDISRLFSLFAPDKRMHEEAFTMMISNIDAVTGNAKNRCYHLFMSAVVQSNVAKRSGISFPLAQIPAQEAAFQSQSQSQTESQGHPLIARTNSDIAKDPLGAPIPKRKSMPPGGLNDLLSTTTTAATVTTPLGGSPVVLPGGGPGGGRKQMTISMAGSDAPSNAVSSQHRSDGSGGGDNHGGGDGDGDELTYVTLEGLLTSLHLTGFKPLVSRNAEAEAINMEMKTALRATTPLPGNAKSTASSTTELSSDSKVNLSTSSAGLGGTGNSNNNNNSHIANIAVAATILGNKMHQKQQQDRLPHKSR